MTICDESLNLIINLTVSLISLVVKGFSNILFNAIHVDQLSNVIKDLLSDPHSSGVINVAGNYTISKYDFICLVANYLNLDVNLVTPFEGTISQDLVIDNSMDKLSLNEGLKLLKKDYE